MTRSEGSAQSRAQKHYRDRLQAEGLARFEVIGHEHDKAMIRTLARRLAQPSPEADRLRRAILRLTSDDSQTGASIYEALRTSPLVGADISFERERSPGRKVEL